MSDAAAKNLHQNQTTDAEPTTRRFPRSRARSRLFYAVRAAIGIAIVSYLLYRYDLGEVWGIIRGASPGYLALAWTATLAAMIALSVLWNMSLRPLRVKFTWPLLLKLQFEQRFHALFMPGAAAGLIRWLRVMRPSGQPGLAFALMVFSRMTVFLCTLLVTATAIVLDSRFPWPAWRWTALVVVAGYGFVLYVGTRPQLQARVFHAWDRLPPRLRFPGLRRRLESYGQAVATFTTMEIAVMLALGLFAQAGFVVEQICLARAVGMELPVMTFGWVRAIVLLCMVVPITISGLGLREASLTAVLALYGVSEQLALAQSLLFFAAIIFVKGIIGGLLELKDALAPASLPEA